MVNAAAPRGCEFFVRSYRKPDQVLVERCSLTGKNCFCEGTAYLGCTRRTFALEYERKRQDREDKATFSANCKVICSEDNPKPPLQGT